MHSIRDDDFAFLSHQDTIKPTKLEDTQNILTDAKVDVDQDKKP